MNSRRMTEKVKGAPVRQAAPPSVFRLWLGAAQALDARALATQAALAALVSLAAVFLASPAPVDHQAGKVAEYTVRADHRFNFLDRTATENRRLEAEEKVPPVFVLDDVQPRVLERRAAGLFQRGRDIAARSALQSQGGAGVSPPQRELDLDALKGEFQEFFSLPDDAPFWPELLAWRFDETLEKSALELALEIMTQGLLPDGLDLPPDSAARPVTVVTLSSRAEYVIPSLWAVMDSREMRRHLDIRARKLAVEYGPDEVQLIIALARGMIQPNLTLDDQETQARLRRASAEVKDVYVDVQPGEVIVQEGTVIDADALGKIRAMRSGQVRGLHWLPRFTGLFLSLFIFYGACLGLSHLDSQERFVPPPLPVQVFIALTLLSVAVAAHTAIVFGKSLSWDFDFVDNHTMFYAVPFPAAAMLTGIFFGARPAAVMAVMASVTAAAVIPGEGRLMVTLYIYNGSVAAAMALRKMNERQRLVPAAFLVMAVNVLTLLGLTLFNDSDWGRHTANNFLAAAVCGLFAGVLSSGLIPVIELLFGLNTNFKMLELGNLDRPILRELMLSAPGTYHHSVIVGAMVEAAAEAIGANPHLAKVGAYYHDIGKMKKPLYFVENQSGENRHDTLAPSMSALVLIGHIREGVELARANRLPQSLIDIIEQHHGVSLMGFFYHKAKEQHQEGQPEVNEGDFRYPGPKPRGPEAGLVMLGDICEAATRSLAEPNPAKIKSLVRTLVNQIFSDGQLDECDLKTSEISVVIQTFTTILIGIYHHRVAYPGVRKAGGPAGSENGRAAAKEPAHDHLPVEPSKGPAH